MFGIKIDRISKSEVLEKIPGFIKSGRAHLIVTLNIISIFEALADREFFEIINKASLRIADGIGVVLASRLSGNPVKERIPGIDLIYPICEFASKENFSLFFLGADEGITLQVKKNLLKSFSNLKIVGTHKGFFNREEEKSLIEKIRMLKPDIVFVGMGQPLQEKWISENLIPMGIPVSIGIGGSFDVIAGKLKRAPKIFQTLGLEWLYRIIQEPSRIKKWGRVHILFKKLFGISTFEKK